MPPLARSLAFALANLSLVGMATGQQPPPTKPTKEAEQQTQDATKGEQGGDEKGTGQQGGKQKPKPDPQGGKQPPKPDPQGGKKPPGGAVDETDITAEALRRLFERLKARESKPAETPVKGKEWKVEKPDPKAAEKPDPTQPDPKAAKPDPKAAAKPDQPKPDAPKPDAPKPDAPKQDKPKQDKPTEPEPRAGRDDPEDVARRMREQGTRRQHPGKPTPAEPIPLPTVPRPKAQDSYPVSGTLTVRQRYRRASGTVKQDSLGLLGVDFGDPEADRVTGHLLARGFLDTSSRAGDDSLNGLDHTYEERYTGRLYDAHVNVHRTGSVRVIRIGRQTLYETPEVFMLDGVFAETDKLGDHKLVVGAHAGVPAHLFESSPSGDLAVGMHVGAQPWQGGRVRLDYMHIDDQRRFVDADNDLLGFSAWQRLGTHANLYARYTRLENRDRDVRVRANYQIPDWNLDLRVNYDELLETQGALATEFDPFNQSLLEYHPYRQVGASVTQQWTDDIAWDLGFSLRRLSRQNDEGQFNRDFDRGFLALHFENLLGAGSSLSVNADAYETDGNDTAAFGVDYRAPLNDKLELSLGSLYSLYKYDFITQRERDKVRTWFGGLHYRVDQKLRMSLDYSYETGEFPDSHSAEARLTWQF